MQDQRSHVRGPNVRKSGDEHLDSSKPNDRENANSGGERNCQERGAEKEEEGRAGRREI